MNGSNQLSAQTPVKSLLGALHALQCCSQDLLTDQAEYTCSPPSIAVTMRPKDLIVVDLTYITTYKGSNIQSIERLDAVE